MRPFRAAGFLTAAALVGCGGGSQGEDRGSANFDEARAFADLRAQVEIGPRAAGSAGSRREVALIVERLEEAGIEGIMVQRPHRNVVATLAGTEAGAIVIGAHHDTKDGIPGFEGANDGASGVAVLLELARVLPRPFPGPDVVLAFFDAEEARGARPFEVDGTRGSRQFVALAAAGGDQGAPALEQIEAMVLLDLVGDCDLQIPRERNSDPGLYGLFRGAPFGGTAGAISDDHIPFLRAGIAAVDLIDLTYGPGPSPGAYWHTPADRLDKVCPESLGQVGRAVIEALEGV